MRSRKRSFLAIAAVALVNAAQLPTASAQVTCGSTVTEKVTMDGDITCPGDPGVTINGGSIDMAGHNISACVGCTGVLMSGQGSKLLNGSVRISGGSSIGVNLAGSGVHKVENVTVVGGDIGFRVTSGKNKMRNCTAAGTQQGFLATAADKLAISRSHVTGGSGFDIGADNCNLTENTATANSIPFRIVGSACKLSRNISTSGVSNAFEITGNGHKLSGNTAAVSSTHGFLITGNENKLSKNSALQSLGYGIQVVGNENKLSKNAANDNGLSGISVAGNGNNVNGCTANDNDAEGILMGVGNANSLKSNVTMFNLTNGVRLVSGSINSSISKTAALENMDPDLQDDNANCDGNAWAKSIFNTSDANGVPAPGCIQ